jgi:hypothetical protein
VNAELAAGLDLIVKDGGKLLLDSRQQLLDNLSADLVDFSLLLLLRQIGLSSGLER